MWTPLPVSAVRVLPSPVFISEMLPMCSAAPPMTCTSKCRWPMVRRAASRTVANASGSSESSDSPSAYRSLYSSVSARSSASLSALMSSSMELTWSAIRLSLRRVLPSPARRTLSMMAGTCCRAPRGSSGSRPGRGRTGSTVLIAMVGETAACAESAQLPPTGGGDYPPGPGPRHNDRYSGRCVRGAARMADQAGSQIVSGTAVPAGGEAAPDVLARAQPGTLSDPGHEHAAFHGRPVSWGAVSIIVAGFLLGDLSLVFTFWTFFWVGGGVVVLGALLAAGTNMFEDWY